MKLKKIVEESYNDYKKPHMFLCTCFCDGKCYKELGCSENLCHNSSIMWEENKDFNDDDIITLYLKNKITNAIVIGGLEPFEQFEELLAFVENFRLKFNQNDDIVIYTGFYENEITKQLKMLSVFENVIVKFGRFIPNQKKHYDEILGVELANQEQYAKKI